MPNTIHKNKIPTSFQGYLYLFNELVPNFSSPLLLIADFKCHQINFDKKNLFVTTLLLANRQFLVETGFICVNLIFFDIALFKQH
ncbi:hypothetical protein CK516_26455 [Nostoc sp. 'Peltigera malacea cyanobiont' DB3992]|nr:hypothetical protein CK516_26455 [Nostoc sp. 'Peltigera malacea cyanobiont' DB3992]